ncbi:MAG: ExbD/TolR family protein, partial [Desulfobulbus sp.]
MLNISGSRRANRSTPGLDIAPLIDMVFILLIFFLVNTSFVKETGI